MHNPPVGNWPWAMHTGGKLSQRDRRSLMKQMLTIQFHRLVKRLTPAFRRQHIPLTIEHLHVPDSTSAIRAAEACAELSPPWLQHHCTRTYLWGSVLAMRDSLKYDEELLFVASMLHDLGLMEAHLGQTADVYCFAVEGARAAKVFADHEQWNEHRQNALAEAISLHLNVTVGMGFGVEAHLLQMGAAYDVLGTSYRAIAPATRSLILEQYPRLGFKREFNACLQQQIVMRPDSRVAFYYHSAQFGERLAHAPFAE